MTHLPSPQPFCPLLTRALVDAHLDGVAPRAPLSARVSSPPSGATPPQRRSSGLPADDADLDTLLAWLSEDEPKDWGESDDLPPIHRQRAAEAVAAAEGAAAANPAASRAGVRPLPTGPLLGPILSLHRWARLFPDPEALRALFAPSALTILVAPSAADREALLEALHRETLQAAAEAAGLFHGPILPSVLALGVSTGMPTGAVGTSSGSDSAAAWQARVRRALVEGMPVLALCDSPASARPLAALAQEVHTLPPLEADMVAAALGQLTEAFNLGPWPGDEAVEAALPLTSALRRLDPTAFDACTRQGGPLDAARYSGHATKAMIEKYAGEARQIMRARQAREKRR